MWVCCRLAWSNAVVECETVQGPEEAVTKAVLAVSVCVCVCVCVCEHRHCKPSWNAFWMLWPFTKPGLSAVLITLRKVWFLGLARWLWGLDTRLCSLRCPWASSQHGFPQHAVSDVCERMRGKLETFDMYMVEEEWSGGGGERRGEERRGEGRRGWLHASVCNS